MSGMTSERLEELRRIAEAATAGAIRQSVEAGERCPKCGALPVEPGAYTYDWACKSSKRISGYVEESTLCLHRQLAQAQDQLQLVLTLLAKLLRGLEWSGWDERFRAHICPVCGGYRSKKKHFPDCDLNKALSFLRDVGRE